MLNLDTDYQLKYNNNINSYEVSHDYSNIEIIGKGNYKGTAKKYFTIKQVDINKVEFTNKNKYLFGVENKPIFKYNNKILNEGKDYTYIENEKNYEITDRFTTQKDRYDVYGQIDYEIIGNGNFKGTEKKIYSDAIAVSDKSFRMLYINEDNWNYDYINKQLNNQLDTFLVNLDKVTVNFDSRYTDGNGGFRDIPFGLTYHNPNINYTHFLFPDKDFTYSRNGNVWTVNGINEYTGSITITIKE